VVLRLNWLVTIYYYSVCRFELLYFGVCRLMLMAVVSLTFLNLVTPWLW